MRKLLESEAMPAPPKWKSAKIVLSEIPDQPQTLYYRDLGESSKQTETEYTMNSVQEMDMAYL